MNRIDKYFLEKAKNVSFIELKEGTKQKIGDYIIKDELPLPVVTEDFLQSIKEEVLENEIDFNHVFKGMLYILGTDLDFKYNDEYRKILKNLNKAVIDTTIVSGIKLIEEENFTDSAIVFRALLNLGLKNEVSLFNYALALEGIGVDSKDLELQDEFYAEALKTFEEILNLKEDFPLAYYKLGYHYKASGQFLKAKLIWDKYLLLDDEEIRKNIIREELLTIDNDIEFEEAVLSIAHGNFMNALPKLKKIKKFSSWWNISYLIGICYRGLNETQKAIEYFLEAIEAGGENSNVYNELGVSYFLLGDVHTAIEKLNHAVELDKGNYESYFNLGIIYNKIGEYKTALENYETAYNLNPTNEYIQEEYMKMKAIDELHEE